MGVPQLNSCCCGCSLKTGTKIIGWLSLIGSILWVATLAMGLAGLFYLEAHPEAGGKDAETILEHIGLLKLFTVFLLIVYLVGCGLAFILLLGTYQNKANLVFIWVVVSLTSAILGLAITFAQFFTPYQSNIIGNVITYLIEFYFILVVYSFYREINNVSTNYA